jgi:hypothetical protein
MIVAYSLNFLVVPFYLSPSFVWKSLRSILPHNEWDRAISVITTGRSSSCKERTTNYMSECMHVCSCSYSVFSTRTFIHYSFIRFTCRNSKVVIQKHIVSYQGGLIYVWFDLQSANVWMWKRMRRNLVFYSWVRHLHHVFYEDVRSCDLLCYLYLTYRGKWLSSIYYRQAIVT